MSDERINPNLTPEQAQAIIDASKDPSVDFKTGRAMRQLAKGEGPGPEYPNVKPEDDNWDERED